MKNRETTPQDYLKKVKIPVEHKELVWERIEKSKKDPSKMLDWDEVSKTLKS
ncbi:MAG: hypothetical protein SGJ10_08790 [Bacteroidota bacterium]|nr:hypothetical protein [Bacteroidota bacterium]